MNLKQVALELGVSKTTVSNAFSRPDQLSKELRERVVTEAAKLGYYGPSLAARSLAKGESGVVAVMLSDTLSYSLSDPVASQMLQGVADVLEEQGKYMLLLKTDGATTEQHRVESLPDAFIFYGTSEYGTREKPAVQRVIATGKPVVLVDFYLDGVTSINVDNTDSAYQIAKHATARNNASVAVLGLKLIDNNRVCRLTKEDAEMDYVEITRDRLAGFERAANENNCAFDFDSIWHIPINNNYYSELAAKEALSRMPRPNVLLCMSDVIALSAMRVAKDMGLRVPEDVSITGYDGIPAGQYSEPQLTTVCQKNVEKGRLAAQMVLSEIKGEDIKSDIDILIRGSTL